MKKTLICLILALSTLFSCTRDEQPTTLLYEFSDIREEVGVNTCIITCRNESVDDETIHARVLLSKNENFENVATYAIHVSGDSLSCVMNDLDRNTLYYYRFEMYTNHESLSIDDTRQFKTLQGGEITVTTSDVINITQTTATGGGSVSVDGEYTVTERGICWGTGHNPDTIGNHTANGTGIGSFAVNMIGLLPDLTYYVRAYAAYANGIVYGNEVSFNTQNANLPTVLTQEVTNITRTTALASGNVTDDGGLEVTERGVCWSTAHAPNIEGSHANNGTGTGAFSIEIGELEPNTTYYVRAYAQNGKGVAYGEEVEFKTAHDVSSPIVTTLEVSDITSTTAKGGGNVTNDGGAAVTERGICWSTNHNPTINDAHASSGTGIGEYNILMADLIPGTTYYVRAYAENSQGVSYGVEVGFTTVANPPIVTTGEVSNITQTTALGSGTVTDEGGVEVTERGLCWSTSHTPSLNGSHASNGIGTGGFTVEMTGLTPNTTYYVRAYAINSQGTAYGDEEEFKTSHSVAAPIVTTSQITNITQNTAKGGGNVTNDGGATVTERGVCWSTEHNPTTTNSHTSNGTGTGSFTCNMGGLTAGTTYYVRAYAKNSEGTSYGAEVSFITEQTITLPTVTTAQVTSITQTTATGGGNVTATGNATVTERGICWSTSHNPTTNGSHASNGGGTGTYSVNMAGLTPNTTYYVRAYATNSAGTAYGSEVSFTTLQNVSLPTVTTNQVTNITQTTATCGGNVTSAGGATVTERGICWSTSHNPTTSNTHANSGTDTGTFTINMTNLTANTTYYVRAYAINSAGTAYGSEVSFTTLQSVNLPTVTTSQVTNITQTTATGGGNVTATGGGTVTDRGICWSTSHNPTISGNHASGGAGAGTFSVNMTGLTANTTYYVRAYATNSAGTAYGSEVSFTTLQNVVLPTVTTSQVTDITQTTATGGGNVTNDGNGTVTERGICWSTSHNPTTSNTHASSGTGTGTYIVSMSNLTANTTYYVRAYAINSAGTAYGSEVSFTTASIPTYTISVSANPSNGGTVTGGGTYQQNQSCTVTATAATGYTFLRWTENGNQVSTNASYTFTVSGNRTLVAQFQAQSYTISVSANPSNGGSVSGGGTFNYGQSCTVTATANSGYSFTNWTENGSQVSTNSSYTFTVNSNRTLVANFTIIPQAPTGAINGLFTINSNGDKVWFSQGNLQYKASTNTWQFATNQYDYVGSVNNNISQTYNGWIDLFGWGTSGYNHGAVCYQPWSTSQTYSDYYAYGQSTYNLYDQTGQADWGYNSISNGGNTINTWRTLKQGEWDYVFKTRSTTSGIRYAKAQITTNNGTINGVILLPDNWSSSYYTLNSTNQSGASFSSNVISSSTWTNSLESHGAVFLPAAGYRTGTSVGYVGSNGFYWSASHSYSNAYDVTFNDLSLITTNHSNRYYGQSVRLVQDY